jgi:hypothetical protein
MAPAGVSYRDAWDGAPASTASGPDSVWIAGRGGDGGDWTLAHWNGSEVDVVGGPHDSGPELDQGTRGSMAELPDGTLWASIDRQRGSSVWSRTRDGVWTSWTPAPAVVDGVELEPVHLRVVADADRAWFLAIQWRTYPGRRIAAVWRSPRAR